MKGYEKAFEFIPKPGENRFIMVCEKAKKLREEIRKLQLREQFHMILKYDTSRWQ